nr:HEAT repeat domain-containing protein [Lysobacter gilvus]
MHSRRSGAIFAERFGNQAPDIFQLRDLAEVGPASRDAGPAVVALLSNPESEIRLGATLTLGFIGYAPSVDALIALLDDPVDARVAWAAAESLGRLRDPRAISPLERTARAHWYPPVRETAASAAASLRNGTTFVGKQEDDDFQLRFIAVWNLGEGVANCSSPVDAPAADLRYRKLSIKKDKASITKLAYPARLTSDDDPPPSMRPELAAYYADIAAKRARWLKTAPDVVPQVAMRVNDGWLAGSDRGEFGGELVFVGDGGTRRQLAEVNVKDLHVLGKRIVMLEGLAHGAIHEIARAPDGTMRATPWRILPGAPRTSWITEHGELLIQLESAGTVLVSPDGNMRMAPCRGV